MAQLIPARCRRCNRPLRAHLTARAGVGPACALFEATEAAQGPQGAVIAPPGALPGPDPSTVALAAVTALVHDLPDHVVDGIVTEANSDVTKVLAGLLAYCIRETDGGTGWLERLALDWAQQEAI